MKATEIIDILTRADFTETAGVFRIEKGTSVASALEATFGGEAHFIYGWRTIAENAAEKSTDYVYNYGEKLSDELDDDAAAIVNSADDIIYIYEIE